MIAVTEAGNHPAVVSTGKVTVAEAGNLPDTYLRMVVVLSR